MRRGGGEILQEGGALRRFGEKLRFRTIGKLRLHSKPSQWMQKIYFDGPKVTADLLAAIQANALGGAAVSPDIRHAPWNLHGPNGTVGVRESARAQWNGRSPGICTGPMER